MSDRMKPDDVDPRAVKAGLAEIKATMFRTKELADLPTMRQAHGSWSGEHGSGYYTSVGSYLSLHSAELGIHMISPGGARNAVWKKGAARH